jgi:hypothetical protein
MCHSFLPSAVLKKHDGQDEGDRQIKKGMDGRLAIIYINECVLEFNYFR